MLDQLYAALKVYQQHGEDHETALLALLRDAIAAGLPAQELAITARDGERTDDQAAEDAGKARVIQIRAGGKCPRCGGPLKQFPEDQGALSRSDNETIVCGPCGADEAQVWQGARAARPPLPGWIDARPGLD